MTTSPYHPLRVGIMATGRMAGIMADTLRAMSDEVECYAVASRTLSKAEAFAAQHGFTHAYGSYQELVDDAQVELVYVATPHSEHYQHALMAVRAGKAVLCEKAFCGNVRQARALLTEAHERGVFVAEAMWIRYKPFVKQLPQLVSQIDPQMLTCSLGYPKWFKPTITQPELCGGAMMDLGVYLFNFARICFGTDVATMYGHCLKSPETGLDVQDTITLHYRDGRMVNMQCSVMCANDRQGLISGKTGYIIVDNINNPQEYRVFDRDHQLTATYHSEPELTGYEYEVRACIEALRAGQTEPADMPHAETLAVLELMDQLRGEWGVRFPQDDDSYICGKNNE